jgi:hypothetical protein
MDTATMEKATEYERREVLADWLDQRVTITGTFERMSTNRNPSRPFLVALVQDMEVELPTKARHHLGHLWIQYAETMKQLSRGDRFRCTCIVKSYRKDDQMVYGLRYPCEVRPVNYPIAFQAAGEEKTFHDEIISPDRQQQPRDADPLAFIIKVRDFVQRVGGPESIQALQGILDKIGGWDRLLEIHDMTEQVGGWERIGQLLALLKM